MAQQQVRSRVKKAVKRVAPGGQRGKVAELETRANRQARRLDQLETEVQELRRLQVRLAELTDIVQELLVPVTLRDEEKLSALLDEYNDKL